MGGLFKILIIIWVNKQSVQNVMPSRMRQLTLHSREEVARYCSFCRPDNYQNSAHRIPKFTARKPAEDDQSGLPLLTSFVSHLIQVHSFLVAQLSQIPGDSTLSAR